MFCVFALNETTALCEKHTSMESGMVFKKYQNMAKIVIKSILLAYQISAPIIT